MAISLCHFFGNISMPVLWLYLYASSLAISLYIQSLCLSFGNIFKSPLWQYIYASSLAFISKPLLWPCVCKRISPCFCEQCPFASASNVFSLLLRAMSLCFCEQYLLFDSANNIFSSLCRICYWYIFCCCSTSVKLFKTASI